MKKGWLKYQCENQTDSTSPSRKGRVWRPESGLQEKAGDP